MTEPPGWAAFLSASAYRHLMRCVEAELQGRGLAYELRDGAVLLQAHGMLVGLTNLAQRCHKSVPPRWPELVKFLFDQALLQAAAEGESAAPARERLRVQLHPDEYLSGARREDFVMARWADGIWACLAEDLPTAVRMLARTDVAALVRQSDEALLALGRDNVRALEPVECCPRPDLGPRVHEISGQSHFTASHVLFLEEHVPMGPDDRVLVWLPNRHTLLCALLGPAEDPGPLVERTAPVTARLFRNGPGSISPHAYWWRSGGTAALAYRNLAMP